MYSCHKVFLTEVFYRKVEKNRIDFPKQIRIKRKYLTSQDEVPILCWIGAEDSVRCAKADRDIVRYVDEADKADDGICSAAYVRRDKLVKFIRAYGGCLGVLKRRRTR